MFKRTLSPFLQDNSVEEDKLLMFPQVSVTLLPCSNVLSSVAEIKKSLILYLTLICWKKTVRDMVFTRKHPVRRGAQNARNFYRVKVDERVHLELVHAQSRIEIFKVYLTPKYFFRLNKSLHLFETHCAFLPLFNPNIDLLQAVKVTKSGHHLSHDRASKGMGLFLV